MARGQPDEETYQPRVMPEDLPRKVVPEMSGNSIGPGISQVGDVLEKKYQADSATWAGDQIAKARTQALATLQAAKDNLPAGQDPGDFAQSYLKSFDDQTKDLTQNDQVASNPYARQMIQKGMNEFRETMAQHVFGYEAAQRVAYREDSLQKNLQSQAMVVQAHPELKDQVASTLTDQANSIGGDASVRLARMRAIDTNISTAAVDGYTRQNPQAMLDALKDPENAPATVKDSLSRLTDAQREVVQAKATQQVSNGIANSVVDTYRNQGPTAGAQALAGVDKLNQPDDVKAQIRADIERGVAQYHNEARETHAQSIIGLETRLASGKTVPGDVDQVWSLYHSGAFTAQQTGETIGRVQKAQEKQVDDDAWTKYAASAYANSIPLDPKDKEARAAVSELFDSQTKNIQPGSVEWINRAADIAKKTGVTPDSMIEWSRPQLVSGQPAAAAQAAQAIERAQEANPRGTPFALDDKDKAMARSINDAVLAGTPAETAVTNARAVNAMPDAEKLRLDDSYKKQQLAMNSEGALRTELKAQPEYNAGWFTKMPDLPPIMTGQFEQLRENYFKLTGGNKDQASDLAMRDLKNTWGITEVNGKREFMQYAPEEHSGVPTAAVRQDMEASVAGHTDDPSKVRLVPTADTAGTNGRVWALGVPDKNGAYDVVRDKNNNPIPYQLPDPAHALAAQRQKEAETGMARLKAEQAVEAERQKNEFGEIHNQGMQAGH